MNIIEMFIKVKDYLKYKINMVYFKNYFLSYDNTTTIETPISIVNPGKIKVGAGGFISRNCQIEAIDRYNEKEFYPTIEIGENVFIGQNTHIVATSQLKIGRDVTISDNAFISDCQHEYKDFLKNVLNQELTSIRTSVGDGCFIGFGAVIQAGTILGNGCIVGANTVVNSGNYEDGCVIVGAPGRIVKKYNEINGKWEKYIHEEN